MSKVVESNFVIFNIKSKLVYSWILIKAIS